MSTIQLANGYYMTTNIEEMDLDMVFNFISKSHWAKGISKEAFTKAIENSLCFGILAGNGQHIGFARVVTDYVTFAYITDGFVLEQHRGKVFKAFFKQILSHAELKVRRLLVATSNAQAFCKRTGGFQTIRNPEMLLEKWNWDIFTSTDKQ